MARQNTLGEVYIKLPVYVTRSKLNSGILPVGGSK